MRSRMLAGTSLTVFVSLAVGCSSAPSAAGTSAVTTGSVSPTLTSRPAAPAVVTDLGPTTFPAVLAKTQTAYSRFAIAVGTTTKPAVKVTHPAGPWTGKQVSVMWLSHVALRLQLHPGVKTNYSSIYDPGFSRFWSTPAVLTAGTRYQTGLAATFNGGFRLVSGDSHGGYWDYGGTLGPHGVGSKSGGAIVSDPTGTRSLTSGAASLVMYKDGTWALGTWRHEVTMTSKVAYVRQQLVPLIDAGRINPLTNSSACQPNWGYTLGSAGCIPWRSGVGITATGDLVYASAHHVTPYQMALILKQAGAVRAMELDINPEWVAAEYYRPSTTGVTPYVVQSTYFSKWHYITGSVAAGTAVNRDFFAAYLR
ncbi:MAG: hypothetical protein WCJ42_09145 [Actinomycetes bacterium]